MDDIELLRRYAEHNSEEAFATLVTRHINLVYSAALRHVRNPHHAEEITQAVFVILARKAGRLRKGVVLSGWLYQAARLTAANFIRSETQRTRREQEAYMESLLNETEPDVWPQVAPLLDTAMGGLGEKDRNAVVLRFFESKSMSEVGTALGISEDAAKKKVSRAVEKLRLFFTKRGVVVPATVLTAAISANSVQAAPTVLVKTATAIGITKGVAASTSTLTLIKGALKVMAWTKMKTVAVIGVAVILATGTTTGLVIQHRHQAEQPRLDTPEATLQSAFRAMSKGDMEGIAACFTTEFKNQFMATAGKGKSDAELAIIFKRNAPVIADFQVIRKETVSDDELILHFNSPRMGVALVPMKKVGSEWKIRGNIIVGEPGGKQPQR